MRIEATIWNRNANGKPDEEGFRLHLMPLADGTLMLTILDSDGDEHSGITVSPDDLREALKRVGWPLSEEPVVEGEVLRTTPRNP